MKIKATSGIGPAHDTVEFEIDAGSEQDRNAAAELLDRFYFGDEPCKCGGDCNRKQNDEALKRKIEEWSKKTPVVRIPVVQVHKEEIKGCETASEISAEKRIAECAAGIRDTIRASTGPDMRSFRCGLRYALNLLDGTPFDDEEDLMKASDTTGYWWEYTGDSYSLWFRVRRGEEPVRLCKLYADNGNYKTAYGNTKYGIEQSGNVYGVYDIESAMEEVESRAKYAMVKHVQDWKDTVAAFAPVPN